jgi:hypothetical protein
MTGSAALHADLSDCRAAAAEAYRLTCRTGFNAPGFCVINLGRDIDSVAFRRFMLSLKSGMAAIHEARTGQSLTWLSAQRFDQQQTTRPHQDGGPDECFLMLGYEPTAVASRLEIFDYSRCAFDLGITPKDFMAQYNPMFEEGFEILQPYASPVPCFDSRDYRILCINNSSAEFSEAKPAWQGVLHTATMLTPDDSESRVIDYTLIAPAPVGTPDGLDQAALEEFAVTSEVGRWSY